ncbi:MAG: hypothetical protein LBC88_09050 [Spirochaetaceae bacterium]|jgi:hypothetical protein|nr:hypothetical protein [Spirochaetaceae bacterium]
MQLRAAAVEKKTVTLFAVFFLFFTALYAENRSFASLFPGMDEETRTAVFSEEGWLRVVEYGALSHFESSLPEETGFEREIAGRAPRFLVESISVIPVDRAVSLLDIYNSLGNVRNLRGREYHSFTRDRYVPLFEDATRIESPARRRAIADPAPAAELPPSDTIYMNLKDNNFGPCFYRADFTALEHGVLYQLTNFKTISYLVVPVMRENTFFTRFYIEPLQEGVLIYCAAGADVSDFVAARVSIPSAIEKRLFVIRLWITDGLRGAG